jgi:hypothetical protein
MKVMIMMKIPAARSHILPGIVFFSGEDSIFVTVRMAGRGPDDN